MQSDDEAPPPIPSRFKAGDTGPGIRCKNCEMGIAIAEDLAAVPVRFRAKCPKCGHAAEYQKSEIQDFVAHRKQ